MKFGPLAVAQARGAVLAHGIQAGDKRLRKGTVIDAEIQAVLTRAGIGTVIAAQLAAGDTGEDEAAARLAGALRIGGCTPRPPATGRVNIHADHDGVFTVSRALVDAINRIDPAITLATVPDHAAVREGQMVATVKMIPFAVSRQHLEAAEAVASGESVFSVHGYTPRLAGLVQTELPTVKTSVLAKTAGLTAGRLARSGSRLGRELRCAHDAGAVAQALGDLKRDHDLLIVFGASAMADFDDVIPAAIRMAGGRVERAGMPVDPGNLLVLGWIGDTPVIGAPGCARSPKENGFDWVLCRLMAGLPVTDRIIAGMGVGGLLMEIASRPQPRERARSPEVPAIDGVVLAAGQSRRMGPSNKLLSVFDGEPLIRRTVRAALDSGALRSVSVVTGHEAERIAAALEGLDVRIVHNRDHATGMASSLKAGLAGRAQDDASVMILLGDMPGIGPAEIRALAKAHDGGQVVRAAHGGQRGNPVILPARVVARVPLLEGDTGARHLIEAYGLEVRDVDLGAAALTDVDTPEALAAAGGVQSTISVK